MNVLDLDGEWALTAVGVSERPGRRAPEGMLGRVIAATVPGSAHTDLLAAGLIDDPFDADNETAQQWVGSTVWRYEREFEWQGDAEEHHDLVMLGLDAVAQVELNGSVVASTANQHRAYRVDIGGLLSAGPNRLRITFAAPVEEAERREAELGQLPHANHHPYNAVRKSASNFGWDWGIDVATSGIWRSIRIESWSKTRIDSVRPLVDVVDGAGVLDVHVELRGISAPVDVVVRRDGQEVGRASASESPVRIVVPGVDLWWPRGHGSQPLYEVHVTSAEATWTGRVGFRTVELDTTADEFGNRFALSVNGRPVLVRGVNWIPDHAFLTEMTSERYARRIADATEAGVNLIRVWGGGIYESDVFYDLCDEAGVLVWQDMLLACAAYSEEPSLAEEIDAEVREAVTRLSPHASLIIWNGNNENVWGFADWGWRRILKGRAWGNGYYRDVFPRILAELDGTRVYTPGSPFSFDDYLHPNDEANGSVHIWDVWNREDFSTYRKWRPRFVAEFGFQGPPAWSTLVDAVHDEPLDAYGAQMLVHQKADDGNGKLERGLASHFAHPTTIDDWHAVTQLNQAAAVRFGIEWFRSLTPYNTGCILWQLNDDWPVVSWAAVDFAERRKPLWYALRTAYRERLITVQPSETGWETVLINDTDEGWAGPVRWRVIDLDGTPRGEAEAQVEIAARGTARIAGPVQVDDPATQLVVVEPAPGFTRYVWNAAEPVEQRLDPSPIRVEVEPRRGGCDLVVTAHAYARDIVILPDRAHPSATVDENVVTLLPGESHRFRLTADVDLTLADIDRFVVRSANEFGARVNT